MYAEQYNVDWWCHCFEPIFYSIWKIIQYRKQLKNKGLIKNVGEVQVKIVFHPEVSKEVNVIVEKSEESVKN